MRPEHVWWIRGLQRCATILNPDISYFENNVDPNQLAPKKALTVQLSLIKFECNSFKYPDFC